MDALTNDESKKEALVKEIISVVQSDKDREFYRAIVERIPELHTRATLRQIQTESPRKIGHPGAYFFNAMMEFANILSVELPEPVNTDRAVPLCQFERSDHGPAPFLCVVHWQEFQLFKPEELLEGSGLVGYAYQTQEPWLQSLSYAAWRMHMFMREKELYAMVHDPYFDKYFPTEDD